jgi:hypothetical protein
VGKVAEFAHDKAAFVLLERNGNLTASELSELLGVSRATAGRIKQRYANTSCETVPYRDEICGDETNAGETSQESAS